MLAVINSSVKANQIVSGVNKNVRGKKKQSKNMFHMKIKEICLKILILSHGTLVPKIIIKKNHFSVPLR